MMFQAAILGGGPGGYEAAVACAKRGLSTALIEARELGGTCLNRGCIPTKALLHGAEVYAAVCGAETFGIKTTGCEIDFAALSAYKDKQVIKLRRGVEALEKANGVTVVPGFGKLLDAHTLTVDGQTVTADNIVLAMGSAPAKPPIPGIEHCLTSDDALALKELPQSVAIIGGGVIGVEFATLFSALGVKTTVLEMLPDILPGVDPKLTKLLRGAMRKVKFINNAKVLSVSENHEVAYELNGEELCVRADCCIVCVGRRPMTQGIGLEENGVLLSHGYVQTDEYLRTSVPYIYAIGDITGKIQLAHVASAQGRAAAANCAGEAKKMDYSAVPACIYTSPEIAYIGLTEADALAKGYQVCVYSGEVAANSRATVVSQRTGTVKLVSDAANGRLLGGQIMAPNATEMIAELSVAMHLGGTVEALVDAIHPHPTISEIIADAARGGISTH